MKSIYSCDRKTGKLIYWIKELDWAVFREYPDGSFSPATLYDLKVIKGDELV